MAGVPSTRAVVGCPLIPWTKDNMKASKIAALILISGLASVAQQDAEFTAWMKTAGRSFGALNKLEKKTGKDAVAGAERLGGVYEQMIGYWRQRNLEDAEKWSVTGKAAAMELASAAFANDADRAGEALKTLGETCHSCHTKYRESAPDGTYRFKTPAPPR
jgi:cytochrome c556